MLAGVSVPWSWAVLIGESNPYSLRPSDSLLCYPDGASGVRLRRILGMTESAYLSQFSRYNLFSHDERWSAPVARERAGQVMLAHRRQALILLGARVGEAFGVGREAFRLFSGSVVAMTLPHPSGRSRLWDLPGQGARARRLLGELRGRFDDDSRCGPVADRGDDGGAP